MIKSRNQTEHTYNESVANEITDKIMAQCHDLFQQLQKHMQDLADQA